MPATPPPDGPYDTTALRAASVRRLLNLRTTGRLTRHDIHLVAAAYGRHPDTVERWMDNANAHNGTYTPRGRPRLTLTTDMHDTLASWHGNVTAAHRELAATGALGNPPASLATFHRAVHRDLSPGQRAALSQGETGRRRHDVHLQRPRGHRNEVWETDHVEASVHVNADGHRTKPWITWFIDHSTCVICGLAITPHRPSAAAVHAAARDAVLTGGHHRPFGGIPGKIRVDRGREFLSDSVADMFNKFTTELIVLPPYSPHLKGTVESVNAAVKHTLFKGMPGYAHTPAARSDRRSRPRWALDELLPYETFVTAVLDWVEWWNNDHPIAALHRRTPAQAWQADPTPLETLTPQDLHTYTLKHIGTPLKITSKGVRWNGHYYVGDWMHGHGNAGETVRIGHEPHHYHRIEIYDADTLHYRGPAFRSDELDEQQARDHDRARRREADRYTAQAKRARRKATARYAPTTTPAPLQRLHRLTATEAAAETRELHTREHTTTETRPDLRHRPRPASGQWTQPLPAPTTPDTP